MKYLSTILMVLIEGCISFLIFIAVVALLVAFIFGFNPSQYG